ncbi:hypothetical protein [Phormidium sp. CCY1219]|nr:hypothetical protein [Phormidium sp. CCY1219]MEB3825982.1 hypothetical protein [Phormidium sp. CCY1219]
MGGLGSDRSSGFGHGDRSSGFSYGDRISGFCQSDRAELTHQAMFERTIV